MMRVMIADDHPIILSGIEAMLRNTAYDVVARCGDGETVLGSIGDVRPDILIVDVQMPGLSGIDVLRVLRGRGDDRPVILLTASIDDDRAVQAYQLGVSGIVLKDTASDSLLRCLDEVSAGGRWIEQSVLQRALDAKLNGPAATVSPLASLSPRERAVTELVVKGKRNREIADALGITEGTVKIHLHKAYEKLGVGSRTELVIFARDLDQG